MPPLPLTLSLTRDLVREIDRRAAGEFGLPELVLMENAGRGCADLLRQLGVSGRVVICCGRGNNGGDGFVIARHLEAAGVEVEVLVFAEAAALRGDAASNFAVLRAARTPVQCLPAAASPDELDRLLASPEWIVDALLGTGATGPVREPFPAVIEAINRSPAQVFAVDLPSGLDCDTGEAAGPCVNADHTATFVAPKQGFARAAAAARLGRVQILPIGIPRDLLTYYSR